MTAYAIVELETTQPLPTICIPADKTGVAFILRRHDKPIGFLMEALSPESVLTPQDLAKRLEREVGIKLLQESIREELLTPVSREQNLSLTVAICTKDRPETLARCVASLLKLRDGGNPTCFEILVVDNAPTDEGTKQVVSALPGVHYVQEPRAGLDFARNRALREATGEIIAYLDDDVTVDRKWLDGLLEAWAENPDVGAFTRLVLPYELATEAQVLFEKRGGFRRGFEKIRYGQALNGNPLYPCGPGIFGAGCNMAFHRDILLKLGGFDEALDTGPPLPGGGDLDMFYRVIRAGYPLVYEPQYLVFHQHRQDLAGLRQRLPFSLDGPNIGRQNQNLQDWNMPLLVFGLQGRESLHFVGAFY